MTEQRKCKSCKVVLPLVLFIGDSPMCLSCENAKRFEEAEQRRQEQAQAPTQEPQAGLWW